MVLGLKFSGILFAVSTTTGLLVIIYRLTIRIYHALAPILSSLADDTLNWSKLIEIVNLSPYDSWRVEGISLVFLLSCWAVAGVHAHIDHSGRLPLLTRNDFAGRIISTRATAAACEYLLPDSAHIQESDAQYLNYKMVRTLKTLFSSSVIWRRIRWEGESLNRVWPMRRTAEKESRPWCDL
jgi:hypothetical protein